MCDREHGEPKGLPEGVTVKPGSKGRDESPRERERKASRLEREAEDQEKLVNNSKAWGGSLVTHAQGCLLPEAFAQSSSSHQSKEL